MLGPRSALPARAHVEAFRSTGTSPGRVARTSVRRPGEDVPDDVVYEVHGPAHAPVAVVLGGISATRHILPTAHDPAPGWWPEVIRPGGVLPGSGWRLVCLDWLAGRPDVSTTDQARAVRAVLDDLGVRRADLVGASYGGMVALAFAAAFPERTRRLVVLCAAHRPHPMATALRSIQRDVIDLASGVGETGRGLDLARRLAMTTYRSAVEFDGRFTPWARDGDGSVLAYLRARGEAFARGYDAERVRALSASIDAHRVIPAAVVAPTTLVSASSDAVVPPWLVEELEGELGGPCRHVRLESDYGHDAFLKEGAAVSSVLSDAVFGGVR